MKTFTIKITENLPEDYEIIVFDEQDLLLESYGRNTQDDAVHLAMVFASEYWKKGNVDLRYRLAKTHPFKAD